MEIFLLLLALLAAGCLAGITAGLFGNGGGFIIVPTLVIFFSLTGNASENMIYVAVGTSLACIIFSSGRALISHLSLGAVDLMILKLWAPWLVIGCLIGAYLASLTSANQFYEIFAIGVLFFAIYFLFPRFFYNLKMKFTMPTGLIMIFFASFLGGFSTLLGIAGGTITVITMSLSQKPMYEAVATASGVGLIIGVSGTLGFFILGFGMEDLPFGSVSFINLPAMILIASMSLITAPIGVKWAHNLDDMKLKRIFGFYLMIVSMGMFWKANLGIN